jgi:hypothetical protein
MKTAKEMRELTTETTLQRQRKDMEKIIDFAETIVQQQIDEAVSLEQYNLVLDLPNEIPYPLIAEYIKQFGYKITPMSNGKQCSIRW